MNRSKVVGALCVLTVLSIGAIMAPVAAAIPTGTTAFTCVKTGKGGTFTKEHCASADKGTGEYSHVSIAENTLMYLFALNTETSAVDVPWKLKSNVGGVVLEIEARETVLNGWLENGKDATTGEHKAFGEARLSFWGATVTKPAGEGCVVDLDEQPGVGQEEHFISEELSWTSLAQGDSLLLKPAEIESTTIATFYVQKCKNAKLNGTYKLTGKVNTTSVDGATIRFTHAGTTAQKTLKLNGAEAGVEGPLTLEASDVALTGDLVKPLSFTTIATP